MSEQVKHPSHYNWHPGGIECWDIIRHMPALLAMAVRYIWRCHHKDSAASNVDKAIECLVEYKKQMEESDGQLTLYGRVINLDEGRPPDLSFTPSLCHRCGNNNSSKFIFMTGCLLGNRTYGGKWKCDSCGHIFIIDPDGKFTDVSTRERPEDMRDDMPV